MLLVTGASPFYVRGLSVQDWHLYGMRATGDFYCLMGAEYLGFLSQKTYILDVPAHVKCLGLVC